MPDLKTTYMGLTLQNPILVASSGLTRNVQGIKDCEEAGAGAVVVKSLFEEVLARNEWDIGTAGMEHPEAYEYLRAQLELQYKADDYYDLICEAKKSVKMPVIASINCISAKWWPEFAKRLEEAGADALELNVFSIPVALEDDGQKIENLYYEILGAVKSKVSIPVAMKVGQQFTALPHLSSQLDHRKLDGLVLFNRFAEPDIDIDKIELKTTFSFSHPDEICRVLRWVAILSPQIDCDLSATTGIKSSDGLIKMLLAGASTVQVASVCYQRGVGVVAEMLKELETWMEKHGFESIDQFRGHLSLSRSKHPEVYLRSQFMEKIRGTE